MDDYYEGAVGARRLMNELDHFLQHVLDSVEPAETLSCAILLRFKNGEQVALKKIYRPAVPAADGDAG